MEVRATKEPARTASAALRNPCVKWDLSGARNASFLDLASGAKLARSKTLARELHAG